MQLADVKEPELAQLVSTVQRVFSTCVHNTTSLSVAEKPNAYASYSELGYSGSIVSYG